MSDSPVIIQRPTLARSIFPNMIGKINEEGQLQVGNITFDENEENAAIAALNAMKGKVQELFPPSSSSEVDKAGQEALQNNLPNDPNGDRAQAIWGALFVGENSLFARTVNDLMRKNCPSKRPTLVDIFKEMKNRLNELNVDPALNENEKTAAERALDAMISKVKELFPSNGKGPVDQAGQIALVNALNNPNSGQKGDRVVAIWRALFVDENSLFRTAEAEAMQEACRPIIPTISSITPPTIYANGKETQITINGENFPPNEDIDVKILDRSNKEVNASNVNVSSDGKSITFTVTVDPEAAGSLTVKISSRNNPNLSATRTIDIVNPPRITGIQPPVLSVNENQKLKIEVENLPPSSFPLTLDIVDSIGKSVFTKTVTTDNSTSTPAEDSTTTIITTQISLPAEIPAGRYSLLLKDNTGWEIARSEEFSVVNPKEEEKEESSNTSSWPTILASVARLNPELTFTTGLSNFGQQDNKITGQHSSTKNYPRGDFERIPNWGLTLRLKPEFNLSEIFSLTPEFFLNWQKFHNFSDSTYGTNRLNVGAGVSVSTSLLKPAQLVPTYKLFYNYGRNAEQYPSLTHPAGDEHTITNSLQFTWKPLSLLVNPNYSWLGVRLGVTHQASWLNYWERSLGFPFNGRSQRLTLNGGLDLNLSELATNWAPNLTLNGAGTLWGYREFPDSLVGNWKKRLTGWSADGKLQWPKLLDFYLTAGYSEETSGGHLKLSHYWAGGGISPAGVGTFELRGGRRNDDPYYPTSRFYIEGSWRPPQTLWYLPQFTVGGGRLCDEAAGRSYPEVYGYLNFDLLNLLRGINATEGK